MVTVLTGLINHFHISCYRSHPYLQGLVRLLLPCLLGLRMRSNIA
jgi:hypothetical protein